MKKDTKVRLSKGVSATRLVKHMKDALVSNVQGSNHLEAVDESNATQPTTSKLINVMKHLSPASKPKTTMVKKTQFIKQFISNGTLLWIADELNGYLPASAMEDFYTGDTGLVRISEQTRNLSKEESKRVLIRGESLITSHMQNLIKLEVLNAASVYQTLRVRFERDWIYTAVDSILISINPYKNIDLCNNEMKQKYIQDMEKVISGNASQLQYTVKKHPHLYGVANDAYIGMLLHETNQSCVIAGESGAGKTEATKLILSYLTDISAKNHATSSNGSSFEDRIMGTNPILEAFGNAKTERNNNSSRFGKLIQLGFNGNGHHLHLNGCAIQSYLLEKSRVVKQSPEERNFHIFYQILAARTTNVMLSKIIPNVDATEFVYLNNTHNEIPNVNDADQWEATCMALLKVVYQEELEEILRVLVGILFLGNVQFSETNIHGIEAAAVSNKEILIKVSKYLGIACETLEEYLTKKVTVNPRETITIPYTMNQAIAARDVLAKTVYRTIFDLVLQRINESFWEKEESLGTVHLGILDIYGFECFRTNGFEQLCINYCNEKLQQYFVQKIVTLELAAYESQGVEDLVEQFQNVQQSGSALVLLEGGLRNVGVLNLIDEQVLTSGNDSKLLSKLKTTIEKYSSHKNKTHVTVKNNFIIQHFAGDVNYCVDGFVEKNTDKPPTMLPALLQSSSWQIFSAVDDNLGSNTVSKDRQSKRHKSLLAKFRRDLTALSMKLEETEIHFVRCIKPNLDQRHSFFVPNVVLSQLKTSGLLDVCNVRKYGYPHRFAFADFLNQYKSWFFMTETSVLVPEGSVDEVNQFCKMLEVKKLMPINSWRCGTTKIFLKSKAKDNLDTWCYQKKRTIVKTQSIIRRFLVRSYYERFKWYVSKYGQLENSTSEEQLLGYLEKLSEFMNESGAFKQCLRLKAIEEQLTEHCNYVQASIALILSTNRWMDESEQKIIAKQMTVQEIDELVLELDKKHHALDKPRKLRIGAVEETDQHIEELKHKLVVYRGITEKAFTELEEMHLLASGLTIKFLSEVEPSAENLKECDAILNQYDSLSLKREDNPAWVRQNKTIELEVYSKVEQLEQFRTNCEKIMQEEMETKRKIVSVQASDSELDKSRGEGVEYIISEMMERIISEVMAKVGREGMEMNGEEVMKKGGGVGKENMGGKGMEKNGEEVMKKGDAKVAEKIVAATNESETLQTDHPKSESKSVGNHKVKPTQNRIPSKHESIRKNKTNIPKSTREAKHTEFDEMTPEEHQLCLERLGKAKIGLESWIDDLEAKVNEISHRIEEPRKPSCCLQ